MGYVEENLARESDVRFISYVASTGVATFISYTDDVSTGVPAAADVTTDKTIVVRMTLTDSSLNDA